ncbi:MAG: 30S ribosomal protein S18 [Patescibacteria group bacterium]|nr:30S ribosomal protein S18 [Patescibacteria group bacterium]MDD5567094.1 30S ribosomal protein S18 [Patescibacteria group bacterium]
MRPNQTETIPKEKACYLCAQGINEIDYKDVQLLQRFISSYAKILPKKRTGTCSKHQRKLALAIKQARQVALLPTTGR